MGRRKYFCGIVLPDTVKKAVQGIVADYDRRVEILKTGTMRTTRKRMQELNNIVDAALEIIEPHLREQVRQDIGARVGYERSKLAQLMGGKAYYKRKQHVMREIALALYLID